MSAKSFDLNDRQRQLQDTFYSQYPPVMQPSNPMMEIYEYFDDFVVVCEAGTMYKVPYTMDGETVVFADRSQWQKAIEKSDWVAVKVAGDNLLDVLAIPFAGKDADGQWFDADTDIMEESFATPVAVYQHGITQGGGAYDARPVIVGRTIPGTLKKMRDGWHLQVALDMTKKLVKGIMDAARNGKVAVSSGSVSHLTRLEVNGKLQSYEKNKPGRIAVWPLAEISLWEMGNGNHQPASRFAVAMPTMKAIYRDAGVGFPEISTKADLSDAQRAAKKAQRQREITEFLRSLTY